MCFVWSSEKNLWTFNSKFRHMLSIMSKDAIRFTPVIEKQCDLKHFTRSLSCRVFPVVLVRRETLKFSRKGFKVWRGRAIFRLKTLPLAFTHHSVSQGQRQSEGVSGKTTFLTHLRLWGQSIELVIHQGLSLHWGPVWSRLHAPLEVQWLRSLNSWAKWILTLGEEVGGGEDGGKTEAET